MEWGVLVLMISTTGRRSSGAHVSRGFLTMGPWEGSFLYRIEWVICTRSAGVLFWRLGIGRSAALTARQTPL
ncbi:hypothetical protein BO86DRAFT_24897 [Aspergillus japonicus CBS 114.51]|uniref:Uncharacterized protein n=2 Tax=Aspergillus TaxID=5052 RepID=A0A2V5IAX0_ASPV1|nr:hypothetical protein BO86DRAFT_24897 [Aspergillus japonicus CBS 114.51]PYI16766.1 hypothetical protein BO99DRAFT_214573 [Aspergillus violaceofuscus CBS 115571]RAH83979.1 hypothetical protein BO86DRAFT_24897 [Aspergillus japonicus CBS 114.51]